MMIIARVIEPSRKGCSVLHSAFCGDCHAMPRPASTPRDEWVEEVNQGFVLYGESGRSDLEVPNYDEVLKFFQFQAPE